MTRTKTIAKTLFRGREADVERYRREFDRIEREGRKDFAQLGRMHCLEIGLRSSRGESDAEIQSNISLLGKVIEAADEVTAALAQKAKVEPAAERPSGVMARLTPKNRPPLGRFVNEASHHWRAAAHEASHATAGLLTKGVTIHSAAIGLDGGGVVNFQGLPRTGPSNVFVSAAGYAGQWLFGFTDEGIENDLSHIGLRADVSSGRISQIRDSTAGELRPHKNFIRELATILYWNAPNPVAGADIYSLWDEHYGS